MLASSEHPARSAVAAALLLALVVTSAAMMSAVSTAPASAAEADLPDVVRRSIEHHGWQRLPELEVSLTVTSRSGSFDVVARSGDLFDYRVALREGGAERVWRHTNDSVSIVADGMEQPLADEAARQRARDFVSARVYFLFPPWRLRDPSVRFADQGLEDWNGRELHRVRVTFESGTSTNADDAYLYWFDPASGRLEQFAYTFAGGMRFRRLIDFRRIEGLLFSDQENYGVDEAGAGIDHLDADTAAALPHVSTMRLENVTVETVETLPPGGR